MIIKKFALNGKTCRIPFWIFLGAFSKVKKTKKKWIFVPCLRRKEAKAIELFNAFKNF